MPALSDYLNNDYKPLDSADTVADVQDFFAEVTFSHFPVVEESVYIGCVSGDDVETFDVDKPIYHYRYAMEGFFARKDAVWLDVLEVFASNRTNVVPVLDDKNAYIGYYEIQDVMRMFNDTPFLKEPGGVIVVEKGIADYSMSEVAQIVESNNGRVLGLFISEAGVTTVQITVKISLGAMNEILQTFRRYNYEVVSTHEEDEYRNSLKERSDYLDKYLNL